MGGRSLALESERLLRPEWFDVDQNARTARGVQEDILVVGYGMAERRMDRKDAEQRSQCVYQNCLRVRHGSGWRGGSGEPVSRHVRRLRRSRENSQDDHGRNVEQDVGTARLKTPLWLAERSKHGCPLLYAEACEKRQAALIICVHRRNQWTAQIAKSTDENFCRKAQWWQPEARQSTARRSPTRASPEQTIGSRWGTSVSGIAAASWTALWRV